MYSLSVSPHDISDVSDAVKFGLEFLYLRNDLMEPADLGVGVVNQVSGRVVLGHGDDL